MKLGYMQGYPDNKFSPKGLTTKAQVVAVLEKCCMDNIRITYDKAGSYSGGKVFGSVAINVPDVTLACLSL